MNLVRRLFRLLWLALDGVLLGLFVIGYAARYLSPRYAWGAELVATGLPYVSLLLLPATLGVLLARRWKLFVVHLILVGLAVVRFVPTERGADPHPDDLVLLTINTSRGGGATAESLGRSITKLMRTVQPDLAAFQEAVVEYHPDGDPVRPEYLLKALVDSMGYQTVGPRPERGATSTPLPVLGRVELLEQTQLTLPKPDRHVSALRVVRTHFRWKGREAVHYNLHLHSFGSRKPWEDAQRDTWSFAFWASYLRQYRDAYRTRAQEMQQIRSLLAQETLPVIISGDFNSTPHNWVFRGLARGLQDAYKIAGSGWGATYHADWPLARIDHILVDPAWKVVDAEVVKTGFSDHKAVVVRLRWDVGEEPGARREEGP